MLLNLLGIRLVLLIGKTIPLPASYDVTSALAKVEVTNDSKTADGFQITFSLAKGILDYSLLLGGTFDAGTRVVIGVILGAIPEVLIDGIITHHQVAPSNDPGMSTLTVTGTDVSIMLDLEEKNQKYENKKHQRRNKKIGRCGRRRSALHRMFCELGDKSPIPANPI